jgi:hypothetical protein
MDDQRFDRLARSLAQRTSRRSVLRAAAAGAAAGVLARGATASAQVDCDAPLVDCNGVCVDLLTDMDNCGACGEICESGLVGVACIGGECVRTSCPAALPLQCGETVDDCVDPATDPNNCGDCGVVCASGVCTNGTCVETGCTADQTVCDGVCVETCCDNNNCGACGNVCTGGLTCFEGKCDCPSGNCPPVKLPNTGSGGTDMGQAGNRWAAMAMAGAAAASALLWRGSAQQEVTRKSEDR